MRGSIPSTPAPRNSDTRVGLVPLSTMLAVTASAGVESCAANVSADIFASHAISSILAAHKLGVGVVRGPELQRRAIATSSD